MTDIPPADLGGGVAVPMVGFGTWQLSGRDTYESVRYALEVGYRHIDTATMYRNEREVGQAIRDSGLDRGDVFITTKLPPGDAGRARASLDASLRALGTDYVDLWLVHWPPRRPALVPVWRDFVALRDEERCRAVGVSNYGLAQIDELIRATRGAARGQPDPVEPVPARSGPAGRARRPRRDRRGLQPAQRHPSARSRPGRDRRPARRHPGPGRPALAPRTRHHRDPEVRPARSHRVELRPVQLLPRPPKKPPAWMAAHYPATACRWQLVVHRRAWSGRVIHSRAAACRRIGRGTATVEGPAAAGRRTSQEDRDESRRIPDARRLRGPGPEVALVDGWRRSRTCVSAPTAPHPGPGDQAMARRRDLLYYVACWRGAGRPRAGQPAQGRPGHGQGTAAGRVNYTDKNGPCGTNVIESIADTSAMTSTAAWPTIMRPDRSPVATEAETAAEHSLRTCRGSATSSTMRLSTSSDRHSIASLKPTLAVRSPRGAARRLTRPRRLHRRRPSEG